MHKYERVLAWGKLDKDKVFNFCEDYKKFLNSSKTEREVVEYAIKEAKKKGFKKLSEMDRLKPGDKIYESFKNKTIILAVIGEKSELEGVRIVASHGDSPRLDLKPLPIVDDSDAKVALLQTGWYGGIIRYQWANTPLEIRGVVVKKDGTVKKIRIGGDESVLVIPELLPHLSRKRFEERKPARIVMGEELKIPLVNMPIGKKEDKERFKKAVLTYLEEKYGISEEDLLSAELEVVPALNARDVGLDRSMVAGYGQDDRVCAYTSLRAILDVEKPEYTSIVWIVDKEEIGSETNASAQSLFFRYFISRIMDLRNVKKEGRVESCLINSKAISADVDVAMNPMYKDIFDKDNSGKLGCGIIVSKYGSAAGKYRGNEAHAEFTAWLRKIFDENNVPWQPGLLVSKADEKLGGGGTIAVYLARLGMDVIDAGPGLLGMHSPYEISSKVDVYSCYLAYKTFLLAK